MICAGCGATCDQMNTFCGRCGQVLDAPKLPISIPTRALDIRRRLPRHIMAPSVSVVTITTAITVLRWVWQLWSSQRKSTGLLPLGRKSPISFLKRHNHQPTVVEETFVYRRIVRRE
ncbi:MAG: hypothetical protein EXR62_05690 [Chloroflexi bacterium]|nr:hypothetical protein [Chloroflexota bacterium]